MVLSFVALCLSVVTVLCRVRRVCWRINAVKAKYSTTQRLFSSVRFPRGLRRLGAGVDKKKKKKGKKKKKPSKVVARQGTKEASQDRIGRRREKNVESERVVGGW